MRAIPNLDYTAVTFSGAWLNSFVNTLAKIYRNIANVVNGNITFGDGTKIDNMNGFWANLTTPGAPNTDFTITHGLERVPAGYLVFMKDRAVDIYTGSVAPTTTQITLRATVSSAVVRIFIT